MGRWSLLPAVVGAAILGGCERITEAEPRGDARLLTGVVVAGADSLFVTLGRTEEGVRRRPEPGAELAVRVEATRIALEESLDGPEACGGPEGFSCYRTHLRGLARAGVEVTLEGTLASGEPVGGFTRIPGPPGISIAGAFPGDTLRVEGGLERRTLPIQGLDDEPGRVSLLPLDHAATAHGPGGSRSCAVYAGPAPGRDLRRMDPPVLYVSAVSCGDGEPWDSLEVVLTFMSHDANFSAWTDRGSELGREDLFFGTTGIPGVFGAAAPGRIVILVTAR